MEYPKCKFEIEDTAILDPAWQKGLTLKQRTVVVKDIKKVEGCESGWMILTTGYDDYRDSNWFTK